jgi:hypothetical protein
MINMPFNLDDQEQAAQAMLNRIMNRGRNTCKEAPGFFTPYKSFSEFSVYVISQTIIVPILGILIAAAAAVTAALAIISALGSFGVAGGAALVGAKETTNSAFTLAAMSAKLALVAAAATILFALGTVLTAIFAPVAILTRFGATAYAAVVKTPVQNNAAAANAEDNLFAEELAGLVPGM